MNTNALIPVIIPPNHAPREAAPSGLSPAPAKNAALIHAPAPLLTAPASPAPRGTAPPLNERQKRFCEAYIRQPVGRYAAIEAGYAPKGAAVQACRLLEQPAVRARIDAMRADIATRNCDRVDAILSKLEAIYEGALSSHQFHAAVRAVELQVRLSRAMRTDEADAPLQALILPEKAAPDKTNEDNAAENLATNAKPCVPVLSPEGRRH